jgi:hypothetical protein
LSPSRLNLLVALSFGRSGTLCHHLKPAWYQSHHLHNYPYTLLPPATSILPLGFQCVHKPGLPKLQDVHWKLFSKGRILLQSQSVPHLTKDSAHGVDSVTRRLLCCILEDRTIPKERVSACSCLRIRLKHALCTPSLIDYLGNADRRCVNERIGGDHCLLHLGE